jgi:hypothetical protein
MTVDVSTFIFLGVVLGVEKQLILLLEVQQPGLRAEARRCRRVHVHAWGLIAAAAAAKKKKTASEWALPLVGPWAPTDLICIGNFHR